MRKILAKELKLKFIETLSDLEKFSYEEGNPFLIRIGVKRYFIFLKNLSPAYFKNSPDVTRVQLPYSDHFSKIFKAEIPFITLGYDADNDTIVSWNPKHVKQRLNAKSNVSLYSRESLQTNVKPNEFKSGYLSNGEKIIIFKRVNLTSFFDNIQALFNESEEEDAITKIVSEPFIENVIEKLIDITDNSLILEIKPLLYKNKVLEAVEVCMLFYKGEYKSMTFKDWFKIVKALYDNNTYETELNHDKIVYSEKDLKEFEINIGKKIIEGRNQLTKLKLEEKTDKDILIRQRKYIEKLEEALTRVKNKTYGICRVTGKLIAKERLFAVPHTTLSEKAHIMNYKKQP